MKECEMAIDFHVLPIGSQELRDSLGAVAVDGDVVRTKLDEYLRAVIVERLEMFNANERIRAQLDRRIEVAVKNATQRLEEEITTAAMAHIRKRIVEAMDRIPIEVKITTGEVLV